MSNPSPFRRSTPLLSPVAARGGRLSSTALGFISAGQRRAAVIDLNRDNRSLAERHRA